MKKSKSFSEAVCAACFILFFLIAAIQCATAQKRYGSLVKWNNAGFFKDLKSPRVLDWSTYPETWDGKQFAVWGASAIGGALWGMREAYHADPYIFERRWGVSKTSFWGSDAWKRNYWSNDPEAGHKPEFAGNFGRDVWHTFGFSSKAIMAGTSFVIGARKQPLKYRAVNAAISYGIQAAFATVFYKSFR